MAALLVLMAAGSALAGGNLSYSLSSQPVTVAAGSTGSFVENVTAPHNNDTFTASLQVSTPSVNPIPASWVSAPVLTFNTGHSPGSDDTKSWTVTFTVPPGATPGTYTATITALPSTSVGAGSGTAVTLVVPDTTAPTTTASVSPAPNAAGWNKANVTVNLSATDNAGGSGVKQITYSASGAQTIASTTVTGASASVSLTNEGTTTVTYSAKDNAGNMESAKTVSVKIDRTAPTAGATLSPTPNAAGWNNTDVTVTLSGADTGSSGVKTLTYSIDGGAGTDIPAAQLPVTVQITSDGARTISFHTTDAADNVGATQTVTVRRDTVPPAVSPADVINSTWRNTNLSQAFTASDGGSGLANAGDGNFTLTVSAESTVVGGVVQPTVQSRTVTDLAGNSTTRVLSALIDKTPPVITPGAAQGTPGNLVGITQWYLSDVTLPVTASDALSGLLNPGQDMSFSVKTSGEGSAVQTPSRDIFDKAGNKAVLVPFSFAVDQTPPAVSPGDVVDTTWRNTDLSQAFTASDGVSGLASAADASFTLTASAESGSASSPTVVTRTVRDAAGNVTVRCVSALIDKTPPVILEGATTGTPGSMDGSTQWYLSDVTVSYSATDSLSGLKNASDASISLTTSGEGSAQSAGSQAVYDIAGNKAVAGPRTFAVDKTAPTVSATPQRGPDQNGWYTGPIQFDFSGADVTSGVASCTPSITYSGPDSAAGFVTATCTDNAGNTTTQTFPLKYDATAPALAVTGVSEGAYLKSAAIRITAVDPLRPDAALDLQATLNGTAVDPAGFSVSQEGHYALIAQASDEAGNTSSQTVHFTIDQTAPEIRFDPSWPLDGGSYNNSQTLIYQLWDSLDPNPWFTWQKLQSQLASGDPDPVDISSPQTVAEEGHHQVELRGVDHAGNEAHVTRGFLIDKQPPATAATVTGTPAPSAGWYRSPVCVHLAAQDPDIRTPDVPGSGVDALAYSATGAQPIDNKSLNGTSTSLKITHEGVTTIQYRAADRAGNEEEARSLVVRYDGTAPTLTVPPDMIVEATGPNGAAVTFAASAADNVDAMPVVTCDHTSGDTFPLGATLVTCTAVDAAGNSVTKTFTIAVVDTTAPAISGVPGNKTVEATGPAGAVVTFAAPTATDIVDGNVPVTCSLASGSTFPLGDTTVTCTAVDAHGNVATKKFTVTVADTTPPVISDKADVVAEATGPDGAVVTFDPPTAADIVDGAVGVICNPTSGSSFALGANTITCTATDAHGNIATSSFKIIVKDTTPPAITAPADITAEATGPAGAAVTFAAGALDKVDGPVAVTCDPPSGSIFSLGKTTVTCTATDAHGNMATATFIVTVQDTTAPLITPPADITAEATGPDGAKVAFSAGAIDKVDGAVEVTCAPASGSTFRFGMTTVTCTGKDRAGNIATATFTVTVIDTTAPVITAPDPITAEATGPDGAAVSFTAGAIDSVDGPLPVTCSPPSGSTFPIGMTTVTCAVVDAHGNAAGASFTVTVADTTAPVIGAAPDVTAEATGPGGAVVSFSLPAATDAVGPVMVTCAPASGSLFPLGESPVTCTAVDAAGNVATKTFKVTVADTTAPAISGVPANQTVEATGAAGAVVTFAAPTATDIVDGSVPVTCSPASGSTFPLGDTTVTCTATDAHGNAASATFMVTVQDTTAPQITAPADILAEATSGGGAAVSFTATASDLVAGPVAVSFSPPSGSTFPLGTTAVTATAMDPHGNKATASFNVTVRDTTGPAISGVPADLIVEAAGPGGAAVAFATPIASDLVDGAVAVTCSPASGSMFPMGATLVTCAATDHAGNTTTATFKVMVGDTTPPVITVSDITATATSSSGALVSFTAGAVDLVDGPVTPSFSPSSPSLCPLGAHTATCTAVDSHGNTATKPFLVTVVYSWSNLLPPINTDGSSVFKLGSTVPVKFQLTGTSAGITNATAKLYCAKVSNGVVGTEMEAVSTAAATTGNLFRYDSTSGQYIFNWGTKGLTTGTYQLKIDLGDGVSHLVCVGLK